MARSRLSGPSASTCQSRQGCIGLSLYSHSKIRSCCRRSPTWRPNVCSLVGRHFSFGRSSATSSRSKTAFTSRRWQDTYRTFQRRIVRHYASGRRWVGDFDLAAFYDTISHELLLRTIFPRSSSNDMAWIADCLRTWSSVNAASGHGHGLPQGPLASDFLAECFLLPVDLALTSCKGYVRYVDDVRLFGATEDDVRSDMILLERLCRERGLIPQSGKFALKRTQHSGCDGDATEHLGPATRRRWRKLDQASARRTFRSALGGKPLRVVDKTRLRYALFRAEPDTGILNRVLRLIPHHPEHTDAFFSFVGRHGYRAPIEELCLRLREKQSVLVRPRRGMACLGSLQGRRSIACTRETYFPHPVGDHDCEIEKQRLVCRTVGRLSFSVRLRAADVGPPQQVLEVPASLLQGAARAGAP
ncbi:MAG: RNA-directed DNA polymerase [Gemmatimonadetes bacterium]|nr:RNA-directed DNA polymerase [Gemmatimonadota bacterium]